MKRYQGAVRLRFGSHGQQTPCQLLPDCMRASDYVSEAAVSEARQWP